MLHAYKRFLHMMITLDLEFNLFVTLGVILFEFDCITPMPRKDTGEKVLPNKESLIHTNYYLSRPAIKIQKSRPETSAGFRFTRQSKIVR